MGVTLRETIETAYAEGILYNSAQVLALLPRIEAWWLDQMQHELEANRSLSELATREHNAKADAEARIAKVLAWCEPAQHDGPMIRVAKMRVRELLEAQ